MSVTTDDEAWLPGLLIGGPRGVDIVTDRAPAPLLRALASVARCVLRTAAMLAQRQVAQPTQHRGRVLRFDDGSLGRVYRETVVRQARVDDPVLLVVSFRLRFVHGRGHRLFRAESLLNTPLFVGFPGFVSKLWLAADESDVYRGVYQWNGAALADGYARALWWVLSLVCDRRSIHYVVLPGVRRDELVGP